MTRTLFSICAVMSLAIAGPVKAQSNLLFIVDSSNSMWGQIDGTAKIDTAKSVLRETLETLPPEVSVGMLAYGHRRRGDCGDVELVSPIGSDAAQLRAVVGRLTPRGKTPIAASLQAAAGAFDGRLEQTNNILLISDGIETCSGNPCAVAEELAKMNIDLKVHVVGFNVDAATRAQLQCIADKGRGQYFDARNAAEFSAALQQTQEIVAVVEPEPEPAPAPEPVPEPDPEPVIYFEDEFDGDDLGPAWVLANPDPDNYLVENGVLTLVSRDGTEAGLAAGRNILTLDMPIPKGDWTATARLLVTPQTMGEIMRLGVVRDEANGLFSSLILESYNYALTEIFVGGDKLARGEATGFRREIMEITDRNVALRAAQFTSQVAAVEIRLEKSGRKYTAFARLEPVNPDAEGAPDGEWLSVQELSSLKTPGDAFALIFGSTSNGYTAAEGEGVIEIDWFRIEVPAG